MEHCCESKIHRPLTAVCLRLCQIYDETAYNLDRKLYYLWLLIKTISRKDNRSTVIYLWWTLLRNIWRKIWALSEYLVCKKLSIHAIFGAIVYPFMKKRRHQLFWTIIDFKAYFLGLSRTIDIPLPLSLNNGPNANFISLVVTVLHPSLPNVFN